MVQASAIGKGDSRISSDADSALYDGMPFLSVVASSLPGFILITLTNRTSSILRWVSWSVIPVKGDLHLLAKCMPFSVAPSAREIVLIPFEGSSPSRCKLQVTFLRDTSGLDGERIYAGFSRCNLAPFPSDAFRKVESWRGTLTLLIRREVEGLTSSNLSLGTIVKSLGAWLGCSFFPVLNSEKLPQYYACFDPVIIAEVASDPSPSLVIRCASISLADKIVSGVQEWGISTSIRDEEAYCLGVCCTTLRDGLLLGTNAEYLRTAGRDATRAMACLGVQAPSFGRLLRILDKCDRLSDLSETDREAYERALNEVESQVLGHLA
ncbi:MAG TPA: hypothetical protein VKK79_10615 [Candidatus Lokiarchaeia archaeon]|nr:hypothetical protein [Candidatus Lokiarchaeia archaeon]